jgi:hypothetical protein
MARRAVRLWNGGRVQFCSDAARTCAQADIAGPLCQGDRSESNRSDSIREKEEGTMYNVDGQRDVEKEIRTVEQLSQQILAELRATRFCHGANHVVILRWDGDPAVANWSVNNFDSGVSLAIDVEDALLEIVPRMQAKYALPE